jgi:hypothetical protein
MHTNPVFGGFQLRENGLWLSDNTVGDATTTRHGLLPKLTGNSAQYLNGAGGFSTPATSGASVPPVSYTDREWVHQADLDAHAFASFGLDFGMSSGGSTTDDNDADARWIRIATGATIGASVAVQASTGILPRRTWNVCHVTRMKTYTSVADVRFWVGMFSAGSNPVNAADPASAHLAAFRYDTSTDGTAFWRCCTKDGTTISVTTTSVAVATDTMYLLWVEMDASEVRFFIDQSLVATHTSNLPGTTTGLGPAVCLTTLVASAKAYRYCRQYGRYRG